MTGIEVCCVRVLNKPSKWVGQLDHGFFVGLSKIINFQNIGSIIHDFYFFKTFKADDFA